MNGRVKYQPRWSIKETIRFIRFRAIHEDIFKPGKSDNGAWQFIANICKLGDHRKLKKKWANLTDKYKKILISKDPEYAAKTWPFFNEIHKYAIKYRTLYPVTLRSKSKTNETVPKTCLSVNAPSIKTISEMDLSSKQQSCESIKTEDEQEEPIQITVPISNYSHKNVEPEYIEEKPPSPNFDPIQISVIPRLFAKTVETINASISKEDISYTTSPKPDSPPAKRIKYSTEKEKLEIKTLKSIRQTCNVIMKYMKKTHNIEPSSSSDEDN